MKKIATFFRKNIFETFFFFFLASLSLWLMFKTFSYNNGFMYIASKAWSDFASHIPLIRSFSFGDNFPPQYPIFPGESIRYHFLFYLLVGLLEKIGFSIDFALNLPSSFSFFALMSLIYLLGKNIFNNKKVGIMAVIFFLFNSSFSFIEFFKKNPLSLSSIKDIVLNSTFPSFGPYDGKIVSAFWNLNIYTNQRHFAASLVFLFFLLFLIVKNENEEKIFSLRLTIIFGILIGLLPFLNSAVFIMTFLVFGVLSVISSGQRKSLLLMLFIGGIISLPRIIFLKQTGYNPHFQFGYLSGSSDFSIFLNYWFLNLGLSLILIPLGFILSSGFQRKVFLSFFTLFFIGNLFQFSPEIAGNHKFFNVFIIVGNLFSAFAITKIWHKKFLKIIIPFILFLMIFSGIIDFFPIANDTSISLADYQKNPDIQWIIKNTPKDSVFLNSSYLYNPASIAGRKIFLGWPYFSWSLGYDTLTRDNLRKKLLSSDDINYFCKTAQNFKINYIIIENQPADADYTIDKQFLDLHFQKIYENKTNGLIIYPTKSPC